MSAFDSFFCLMLLIALPPILIGSASFRDSWGTTKGMLGGASLALGTLYPIKLNFFSDFHLAMLWFIWTIIGLIIYLCYYTAYKRHESVGN